MTWAHLGAAAGGVLAVMGVGGALLIGGGFVSPASEVKAQAAKLEQTQSVVHRLATEQAVQGERVRNIEAMVERVETEQRAGFDRLETAIQGIARPKGRRKR